MTLWVSLALSWGAALVEFFGRGKTVVFIPYAIVVPIVLLLPRFLWRVLPSLRRSWDGAWLASVQRVNLALVAFNIPGSLWLHAMGIQYDRFLHFAVGIATVFLLSLLALGFEQMFLGRVLKKDILIWSGAFMLIGVFLWELLQFTIDRASGSRLFYDVAQDIRADFIEDIAFGLLGSLVGLWWVHRSLFERWSRHVKNPSN